MSDCIYCTNARGALSRATARNEELGGIVDEMRKALDTANTDRAEIRKALSDVLAVVIHYAEKHQIPMDADKSCECMDCERVRTIRNAAKIIEIVS